MGGDGGKNFFALVNGGRGKPFFTGKNWGVILFSVENVNFENGGIIRFRTI